MENSEQDKGLKFWVQQAAPGRTQLIELGKFLSAQHLPMIILYLRSEVYRQDILEKDRKELQGFVNILYANIRLLEAFEISVGFEIWYVIVLFFDTLPVRDEFFENLNKFEDLSRKFFFQDQTQDRGDRAENLFTLQSKLIAHFKFQIIEPILQSLIHRFEGKLPLEKEDEDRDAVRSCLKVLYFLEFYLNQDRNNESEHFHKNKE